MLQDDDDGSSMSDDGDSPYLHHSGLSFEDVRSGSGHSDPTFLDSSQTLPQTSRPGLLNRTSQFVTSSMHSTIDATKTATRNTTANILKTAGSATSNYIINPTATIVARDILPELFTLLYDYIKAITPQRGRDVARIFGSGGRNLMHVLSETPRGQSFLATNAATFDSFISTISSPIGRQLVIDYTSHFVKTCEAAATPEAKAAMDSGVEAFCRLTDVLASDRAKEFYRGWSASLWEGAKLMADGNSALAAAEVVANVCHALEMEDEVHSKEKRRMLGRRERTRRRRAKANRIGRSSMGGTLLDGEPLEAAVLNAFGSGELEADDLREGGDGDWIWEDEEGEGEGEGEVSETSSDQNSTPKTGAAAIKIGDRFTLEDGGEGGAGDGPQAPAVSTPLSTPAPRTPATVDVEQSHTPGGPPPPQKAMGDSCPLNAPLPPPSATKKGSTRNGAKRGFGRRKSMADEGFVQPGYDLDIFEYRLGLRKETLQKRGKSIRKAAKSQKKATSIFGTTVEASVERKREKAGGAAFHLAAAAAGLGSGGVLRNEGRGRGGGEVTPEPYKPEMTQAELALERWIVYLGLLVLGVVLMVLVWLTLGLYGLYVVFFGGVGGVGGGVGGIAGGVGLGGVGGGGVGGGMLVLKYLNEAGELVDLPGMGGLHGEL
ncbi:hypothetical protein TrLO_g14253 [Triparma laevis f. longispina]|uniref:Uncharacterized protein n=1 Tax=Triparma laevis f. longispina TaxID=1714387 RepID=A0A9W7KWT3_9STRA|nr:hypothetical protein TrLO_g14253 [Triparma laevis f. longispina]